MQETFLIYTKLKFLFYLKNLYYRGFYDIDEKNII